MGSDSVALVGAYSMSNYGDRLYPDLLAGLLRREGVVGDITHYGLIPGTLEDGTAVLPLREMRSRRHALAIVGGGDLIRTDTRTVAMDHVRIPSDRRRLPQARLRARRFVARHVLEGPGAWLPAAGWGCPTMLASVGVHELPRTVEVTGAVAEISHAWVRTRRAGRFLEAVGGPANGVTVAPDAAFLMSQDSDQDAVAARGASILRAVTGASSPATVFHVAGFAGWTAAQAAAALESLPHPTVALALGSYAGEQRLLGAAARKAGVPLLTDLATSDVTAVLAAAGCVVSTSMHAAIVGSCFGTPIVVPDVEKTRSAFEACPEPPRTISASKSSLAEAVQGVVGQRISQSFGGNAEAVRVAFHTALSRTAPHLMTG